jgi:predicted phosphodiesterase
MNYKKWGLAVIGLVVVYLVVSCQKDPFQVLFHPTTNSRVSDSISGQVGVPAPIPVNNQQFNFAVFGDVHMQSDGTSLLPRLAGDLPTRAINFFVILGDITEDGSSAEFAAVKSALVSMGTPFYATIGNHDLFQGGNNGGWNTWKSTFGAATYSVTIGNAVKFIFLDTASGEIGDVQFAWLQGQLGNKNLITFVCSHYGLADGLSPPFWRLESVDERYKLTSLLNTSGAYAMVAGHRHAFQFTQIGNLQHFLAGTMYPKSVDAGSHGYLLFSYNAGAISWKMISLD